MLGTDKVRKCDYPWCPGAARNRFSPEGDRSMPDEKGKATQPVVVEVPKPEQPPDPRRRRWTAQQWRRFWVYATFLPCVLLPMILAIVYYNSYAADRYAVEMKFAVKSPISGGTGDFLGLMTGVNSSSSTVTDSYIVVDFIESQDLVQMLEDRIDLRAIYARPADDILMRFDPTLPNEDFTDYLARMITVYFDISSQIITVEVQAFTPEDARAVAELVLKLCGDLVNDISERARLDTVRIAEEAVERAENNLREQRRKLAAFREQEQDIDPGRSVEAQNVLLGRVQGELTDAETRMATLREFLSEDAPSVRYLQSQIDSLRRQLAEQKGKLGVGTEDGMLNTGETLTARVGAYEELSVDLEFLQNAYVSSLASLETARLEADRQQRYLAAFVLPKLPQKAIYPNRELNVFVVFIFALMVWGLTVLLIYMIREHAT
jgi:capsular polysaccharide transport system permease protein